MLVLFYFQAVKVLRLPFLLQGDHRESNTFFMCCCGGVHLRRLFIRKPQPANHESITDIKMTQCCHIQTVLYSLLTYHLVYLQVQKLTRYLAKTLCYSILYDFVI